MQFFDELTYALNREYHFRDRTPDMLLLESAGQPSCIEKYIDQLEDMLYKYLKTLPKDIKFVSKDLVIDTPDLIIDKFGEQQKKASIDRIHVDIDYKICSVNSINSVVKTIQTINNKRTVFINISGTGLIYNLLNNFRSKLSHEFVHILQWESFDKQKENDETKHDFNETLNKDNYNIIVDMRRFLQGKSDKIKTYNLLYLYYALNRYEVNAIISEIKQAAKPYAKIMFNYKKALDVLKKTQWYKHISIITGLYEQVNNYTLTDLYQIMHDINEIISDNPKIKFYFKKKLTADDIKSRKESPENYSIADDYRSTNHLTIADIKELIKIIDSNYRYFTYQFSKNVSKALYDLYDETGSKFITCNFEY